MCLSLSESCSGPAVNAETATIPACHPSRLNTEQHSEFALGSARSLGTVDWDDAVRLAEKLFVEAKFKHENGLSVTPHGLACRFNRRRRCQRRRPCLERFVPCLPPLVGQTIG